MTSDRRVLLLPGWQDSDPEHWQSRWERRFGHRRVVQDDWWWPRRGDWMARLEDELLADPRPAVLVAHSLGCQLVAAWAGHTTQPQRVAAALLVAPPDVERPELPPQIQAWAPMPRRRLPFASLMVASDDDPYCAPARAQGLAADWGCEWVLLRGAGHINSASGLGDWTAGQALLQRLTDGLPPPGAAVPSAG